MPSEYTTYTGGIIRSALEKGIRNKLTTPDNTIEQISVFVTSYYSTITGLLLHPLTTRYRVLQNKYHANRTPQTELFSLLMHTLLCTYAPLFTVSDGKLPSGKELSWNPASHTELSLRRITHSRQGTTANSFPVRNLRNEPRTQNCLLLALKQNTPCKECLLFLYGKRTPGKDLRHPAAHT